MNGAPKSEVFNEDCLIGMKRYPDKFFDLACVDPPYGINAPNMQMGSNPRRSRNDGHGSGPAVSTANRLQRLNGGGGKLKNRILNTSKIDWDFQQPTFEYFDELSRISKNQIVWGGNYFDLGPTRCVICWDKMQPWENFSQWEMAWSSFDSPARLFRYSNTGGNNEQAKIHPTQKPVKLYKWILTNYAQPGMKILDTHMGSQSSRIAAFNMGFDYWGWELDPEYFEAGNKRFKEQTAQGQLFDDPDLYTTLEG